MTQLYRCDKCGYEVKHKTSITPDQKSLWELRYNQWPPIADLCDECRIEFDEVINKFFGKIVIEVGSVIKVTRKKSRHVPVSGETWPKYVRKQNEGRDK